MTDAFYLGKRFDPTQGQLSDQTFQYNPDDLTTHGVVVGMTGSGKTGLCITLLEEAALQGLPAILIDPKGDLTNVLLHFPDLAPQDFQPWLDPELARRAGKSLEQASADAASSWRNGLNEWGIGRERLLALKNAAQFAVYTPGSDAGIPVSVLSSLAAPGLDWNTHREVLTERIASTVTAILGLVGYDDIDPIRSREHILLANIFQSAWSKNQSLDLAELILQIQTPPFEKLGAFPVDAFFPPKERMNLALQLNNILAAPTFELWRVGQALDIPSLLRAADGRPRHSVFYISHLSEPERMFFVTLLLTSIETWMRTQAGATSLRALLYMDEIYGYLPPSRNPSSKQPLLRMLKQARAFGLGLLLATQNPVDIDYKALSNAGTWFIGKLQTEQDKQRLLDGLESAAPKSLNRSTLDKLISGLGKRVFIMNNVHEDQPIVFQTRWAMNFLAGPMTRAQIPALNKLAGAYFQQTASSTPVEPSSPAEAALPEDFEPLPAAAVLPVDKRGPLETRGPSIPSIQASSTRPSAPAGVGEFFLPMNLSFPKAAALAGESLAEGEAPGGVVYRPVLAASAEVRFFDRKYNLDSEIVKSALVVDPETRGNIQWDDFDVSLPDASEMDPAPAPQARFASLDTPLSDAKMMGSLQKDFADWVYRTSRVIIRANKVLGLFATPDVSQAEFIKACAEAAREARDAAVVKATSALDKQIKSLKDKIAREERELKMDEVELGQRKGEELATHAENILGAFGGSRYRRLSTSLTKRRLTEQAKEDVQESIDSLEQYDQELQQLEETRQQALETASGSWGDAVNEITEVPVLPKKADIYIKLFGVAWMPYYQMVRNGQTLEIPAFRLIK
jgi:hypothetical protein